MTAATDPIPEAIDAFDGTTMRGYSSFEREGLTDVVRNLIADALDHEADILAEQIRTHGAGMWHGCDTGASVRCETRGQDEVQLRRAAARFRGQG